MQLAVDMPRDLFMPETAEEFSNNELKEHKSVQTNMETGCKVTKFFINFYITSRGPLKKKIS